MKRISNSEYEVLRRSGGLKIAPRLHCTILPSGTHVSYQKDGKVYTVLKPEGFRLIAKNEN